MPDILPIVSVIVPTTHDREEYNQRIVHLFKLQDYPNKELLFDYEPGTVGVKRNRLCDKAIGDLICHVDSDDIVATNWITNSVFEIQKNEADIVGLSQITFFNTEDASWYIYSYPTNIGNWVAGGTFAYWKNFWRNNPFPEIQIGEDNVFLKGKVEVPKIHAHGFTEGFVAVIHDSNTSKKILHNSRYRRCSVEEEIVLFERWKNYVTNPNP